MTFRETIFGTKKPTTETARAALAKAEADLAEAPARIARAEAALRHIIDMSDAEHEAAENELAAATRSAARLEAKVNELTLALAEAERADAASALRSRADAARKRLAGMEKLLDTYDIRAAALAETTAEIAAIEANIDAANRDIEAARRVGLDAPDCIERPQARFRAEPDHVTPDTVVENDVYEVQDGNGRWTGACVFVTRNGETVPEQAGWRKRRVKHVIPGTIRRGQSIAAPHESLLIPPSRIGGVMHWPRSK